MSFCTACGTPASGQAFCTSCGTPVSAATPGGQPAAAAPAGQAPTRSEPAPWAAADRAPARRQGPLTLLLVGLTVALVGVAAFLLLRPDDGPPPVAAPTPAPTSERSDAPQEPTPSPEPPEPSPGPSFEPVPTGLPSVPPSEPAVALPATPFQVVILASKTPAEGGRAAVEPLAAEIEAAGYPALVFTSQDYGSLRPGYWVAAAGPFPDAASAASAATAMRTMSSSFGTAYPRCVGQAAQCP